MGTTSQSADAGLNRDLPSWVGWLVVTVIFGVPGAIGIANIHPGHALKSAGLWLGALVLLVVVVVAVVGSTSASWTAGRRIAGQGRPQTAAARASIDGLNAPKDATVEKLRGLAQLHAEGVLTDEEFAAAKRRLLEVA